VNKTSRQAKTNQSVRHWNAIFVTTETKICELHMSDCYNKTL